MNDCITTTKQSTTKPCAYFLGYTVYVSVKWTSPGPATCDHFKRKSMLIPKLDRPFFSRILDDKNTPFSVEIADFDVQ